MTTFCVIVFALVAGRPVRPPRAATSNPLSISPLEVVGLALQGTLDALALVDLLRFLAATAKTGRLHISGNRGQGQLWFDHGTLATAAATGVHGTPALHEILFELLRYTQGTFTFTTDDTSPDTSTRADISVTIDAALCLLDEWRNLETTVPSPHHRVVIVRELAVPQVSIDAPLWPALAAITNDCTVAEITHTLGTGELDTTRSICRLVQLGVVAIQEPTTTPATNPAPALAS